MYEEIKLLATMLVKAGIPFEFSKYEDGYQITLKNHKTGEIVGDATQSKTSYGSDENLLEVFGDLLTEKESQKDSVLGYLTAENVYKRIKKALKEV